MCKLSPGWSRRWLEVLLRYQRGELDWPVVEAAANVDTQREDDLRLRIAAAHFFRGVRALARGQRARAVEALGAACRQYDNENYCFRAKLLLIKLQADPTWPSWLPAGGTATP